MATGTCTLAWLMLVAGQAGPSGPTGKVAPVEVEPISHKNFQIPIHVSAEHRNLIKELLLWVSVDQGQTWRQAASAKPDDANFTYYAPNDGLYWFNVAIVDAQGRQEPADLRGTPPRRKIFVDTVKPVIRITRSERQGDDADVAWNVQDEHLDPATLKLEYQPAGAPSWTPAPISQSTGGGRARFRLGIPGPVALRIRVQDQAGNLGEDLVQLDGNGPMRLARGAEPTPVLPPAGDGLIYGNTPPQDAGITRSGYTTPPQVAAPSIAPPMPNFPSLPLPSLPGNTPTPSPGSFPPAVEPNNRAVATTTARTFAPTPAPVVEAPIRRAAPAAPTMTYANTTDLSLNYQVQKQGPTGVGEVELFVTEDDGRTWASLKKEQNPRDQAPITARVEREGVYGLTLVLRNRAGIGKAPPQRGDPPQMKIEVDTTLPEGTLLLPRPEPGKTDRLILEWKAEDKNLGATPITLEYAETRGQWRSIVSGHANQGGDGVNSTGLYVWTLPKLGVDRVYLRLTVQDLAGNRGVAETAEPTLIDLIEPEGGLTGVATAGDSFMRAGRQ